MSSPTTPAFPSLTKTIVGMTIATLRVRVAQRFGRAGGLAHRTKSSGSAVRSTPVSFFGRRAPLEVEIGSGKARFLIASARARPAHDFLGIERSLSYYRICRDRLARAALANARIVRADGRLFVETALAPASVAAFHIYFPDPWPKKKQKKRRLLDGDLPRAPRGAARAGRAPSASRPTTPTTERSLGPLLETVSGARARRLGEPARSSRRRTTSSSTRGRGGRSGDSLRGGPRSLVFATGYWGGD